MLTEETEINEDKGWTSTYTRGTMNKKLEVFVVDLVMNQTSSFVKKINVFLFIYVLYWKMHMVMNTMILIPS